MARRPLDLTGNQFANLRALEVIGRDNRGNAVWRCKCICGSEIEVPAVELKRCNPNNCGCLRKELARKKATKHGMFGTPEYCSWESMRRRCYNPNNKDYHLYGARGIRVCAEWNNSFEVFYKDMGARPDGTTLDRIRSDSDYSKENCRWSDAKKQTRNRKTTILIEYEGRTVTLKELSIITGIKYTTLWWRKKHGLPLLG